jgi:hypothetical protein
MWLGLWRVLVPPSPKFHDQEVGVPPVKVPVKATVSGAEPLVGVPVKFGTGRAQAVM